MLETAESFVLVLETEDPNVGLDLPPATVIISDVCSAVFVLRVLCSYVFVFNCRCLDLMN